LHSEFNPSANEPVHFFQIWIEPATKGTQPSYEQIRFHPEEKRDQWKRLAGPEAAGAARINQDAQVFVAELGKGKELQYLLSQNRAGWLHVVRGDVTLNRIPLRIGDAAAVSEEQVLELTARDAGSSEVLLFDLG